MDKSLETRPNTPTLVRAVKGKRVYRRHLQGREEEDVKERQILLSSQLTEEAAQ